MGSCRAAYADERGMACFLDGRYGIRYLSAAVRSGCPQTTLRRYCVVAGLSALLNEFTSGYTLICKDVFLFVYRNVSGSRRAEQCSWRKAAKGVL